MTAVMLLSGGLDSAAIAAIQQPPSGLFIDYGQSSAAAERASARYVSRVLAIDLAEIAVDLSPVGSGLLVGERGSGQSRPEFFPFRNQLLVSLAAAHCVQVGLSRIMLGITALDASRLLTGRRSSLIV